MGAAVNGEMGGKPSVSILSRKADTGRSPYGETGPKETVAFQAGKRERQTEMTL